MFVVLAHADFVELSEPEYRKDFVNESIPARDGWKLEVGQDFQEPGNASWEAAMRGDWEESMRLLDEKSQSLADLIKQPPYPFYRVRIVKQPLTDYMKWELESLRRRAHAGESIRTITTSDSADEMLLYRELVTIGSAVAYRIVYSDSGSLIRAHKFVDIPVVVSMRVAIQQLYESAIDLD